MRVTKQAAKHKTNFRVFQSSTKSYSAIEYKIQVHCVHEKE